MEAFLKTGKVGSTKSESKADSSKKKGNAQPIPWVEKYRPKTVDDVVEQAEVVAVLRQCLKGADLPNLLLYGPPGTGKTSTVLAAARQLFGDLFRERTLELNASDDRGIQVIRDKVKSFANIAVSSTRAELVLHRTNVCGNSRDSSIGKPCVPLKLIILDEADSMTHAAQAALRRTMEIYTSSTRFCLVCNYVSRIIPPIASRCTKFRFKPLGKEKLLSRLSEICKAENAVCNNETLLSLVDTCGGDMRKAITSLQSCSRLKDPGEEILVQDVLEVTGVIPDNYLTKLLEVCRQNKYTDIEEFINGFLLEAFSAGQLLEQLASVIIKDLFITDRQKADIFEKLALCSSRLQDGASEYIQLIDLCCSIAKALHKD